MPGEESLMGPMMAGAGISAAGSLASSALGMVSANRQMKFQERMSNSAYQRAVKDMRAAGLNPMLMYSKASPASTPSGTSFTPENPLKEAGPAVAKGLELKMTNARVANETAATTAQVQEANARTRLIEEQANNARIDAEIKRGEAGRQGGLAEQLQLAIDNARKDLAVKTATIGHTAASTKYIGEQTRREHQMADLMESLIPIVKKGGDAIQKLIRWLENPNTSTWKEVEPFFSGPGFKNPLTHMGNQWGLLTGPSIIKDRILDILNEMFQPHTQLYDRMKQNPPTNRSNP